MKATAPVPCSVCERPTWNASGVCVRTSCRTTASRGADRGGLDMEAGLGLVGVGS